MTIKQKVVMVAALFCLGVGTLSLVPVSGVSAVEDDPAAPATTDDETPATGEQEGLPEESCTEGGGVTCCGKVKTSLIGGKICEGSGDNSSADKSTIWNLLIAALNIMTAGIGVAAVGGIVYGALLYTTAEDKPDQTKKAIGIITNVVIGLVAYALMFVLLNYLIPGGIFT